MRSGEIALWYDGKIIWLGALGSDIGSLSFDAVSFSAWDFARMNDLVGDRTVSTDVLRSAIAEWWG
jgi:hypothetical protein